MKPLLAAVLWALAFVPLPARAADAHLAAGIASASYAQTSGNSALAQSDAPAAVALRGTAASLAIASGAFDAEASYLSLRASGSSYFRQRTEFALSGGLRFDAFPHVVPSLGLYRQTQTSDRSAADAPIAFVDKTQTLMLGLRSRGTLGHMGDTAVLAAAEAHYLTNGQSGLNQGNSLQASLGGAYQLGGVAPSLTFTYLRSSLHAGTRQDGVKRDVHSTLTGLSLSLGLEL